MIKSKDAELEGLVNRMRKRAMTRLGIWLCMLLVSGFFLWAWKTELDEVAIATGKVVPIGQLQVVQHLEGGVIEDLLVAEGDPVEEGQVLLRLNLGAGVVNPAELRIQREGLLIKQERLKQEADGADVVFPEEMVAQYPRFVETERANYQAKSRTLASSLRVLEGQIDQRRLEKAELQEELTAVRNNLRLVNERFDISSDLLKDGLTSRVDHLQLQAEKEQLQGQRSVLQQAIPRVDAGVAEINAQIQDQKEQYKRAAQEELSQVQYQLASVEELLNSAQDQEARADVKSPTKGIVKNMRTNTLGGVVRPGEAILEIVPVEQALVIEAELNPIDRGYVQEGQDTTVKISTYDYARYGGLQGRVSRIGASTNVGSDGIAFYEVIVETDKSWLGDEQGLYPIQPGMEATVDIHTGKRTVLDYLIRPVLKLRHEAFRER